MPPTREDINAVKADIRQALEVLAQCNETDPHAVKSCHLSTALILGRMLEKLEPTKAKG